MNKEVKLSYFSDTLCIWAYTAQVRLDELQTQFGSTLATEHHFISVFGNTEQRIGEGWKDRGGFTGFSKHVLEVAEGFPHVEVNPDIWTKTSPKTSATSHLYLKAIQLLMEKGQVDSSIDSRFQKTILEELSWRIRCAFFIDARDIGSLSVLNSIAEELMLPQDKIQEALESGEALALLISDLEKKELYKLEGSPSYVLNSGRQKLYGNIGYKVIEANVKELFERDDKQASWC
jgi:predicted DsbA family dithiol-disulfide isomerase